MIKKELISKLGKQSSLTLSGKNYNWFGVLSEYLCYLSTNEIKPISTQTTEDLELILCLNKEDGTPINTNDIQTLSIFAYDIDEEIKSWSLNDTVIVDVENGLVKIVFDSTPIVILSRVFIKVSIVLNDGTIKELTFSL